MKKYGKKESKKDKKIKALAYLHISMPLWGLLLSVCLPNEIVFYSISAFFIVNSIWTLVGYKLKWKHIFCSFQFQPRNPQSQMTPNSIRWGWIEKSDVYGSSILMAVVGVGMLIVAILRSNAII